MQIIRFQAVSLALIIIVCGAVPAVVAQSQPNKSSDYQLFSGWAIFDVNFDGKVTDTTEWSDAYAQTVVLYHEDSSLTANYRIKNNDIWVYFLVTVEFSSKRPDETGISYYWPFFRLGKWEKSVYGGVYRWNQTIDMYGWNETSWQNASPGQENVKGAVTCSANTCSFEYAKKLASGNAYDWSLIPGDTVGDKDLVIGVGFDTGRYERYAVLHLSERTDESPSRVESRFTWQPEGKLGFGRYLVSPDFLLDVGPGTYGLEKVRIESIIKNPSSGLQIFEIGVTVGSAPGSFALECSESDCRRLSSNKYYGVALMLEPAASGGQMVETEIDFRHAQFSVSTSNSSHLPTLFYFVPTLGSFSYDSTFATSRGIYLNLVFWSAYTGMKLGDLAVQNAMVDITLIKEQRLKAMMPKPRLESTWTWAAPRHSESTVAAGTAVSDDGKVLAAINSGDSAEVYLLDAAGRTVWSKTYASSQFYWNLLNVGLTPDSKFATYAIFSSANSSNAGIWYVDGKGNPIWVHNEPWYHSVATSSDGKVVAAVKAVKLVSGKPQPDGNLLVLDELGQVRWQQKFTDEVPMRVAVSPEGEFVAITTGVAPHVLPQASRSSVDLYDKAGKLLWSHAGSSIARCIDVSTQAQRIVVGYSDGTIEILDHSGLVVSRYLHRYQVANQYEGSDTWGVAITDNGVESVSTSEYSLFVFGANLTSFIAMRPLWTGEGSDYRRLSATTVAVSSGGKFVVAGTSDGHLLSFEMNTDPLLEYCRILDQEVHDSGVTLGGPGLDEITSLDSQGKWLEANVAAEEFVNATATAFVDEYSDSQGRATVALSRTLESLNATTARLEVSRLDSVQLRNATDLLSQAEELANLARLNLNKAPDEFQSGNYPLAVRILHNAIEDAQQAQTKIDDANATISESVPTSSMSIAGIQPVGGLLMILVAVVVVSITAAALIRRKKRTSREKST